MSTEYTFDYDLFSDLHKEAYGFRPRAHEFYDEDTTDARRQEIWDFTIRASEIAFEEEQERQAEAVKEFEARVDEVIACGAGDRATAIRWIRDAEDAIDDSDEYLEFCLGLPFHYLAKEAA